MSIRYKDIIKLNDKEYYDITEFFENIKVKNEMLSGYTIKSSAIIYKLCKTIQPERNILIFDFHTLYGYGYDEEIFNNSGNSIITCINFNIAECCETLDILRLGYDKELYHFYNKMVRGIKSMGELFYMLDLSDEEFELLLRMGG